MSRNSRSRSHRPAPLVGPRVDRTRIRASKSGRLTAKIIASAKRKDEVSRAGHTSPYRIRLPRAGACSVATPVRAGCASCSRARPQQSGLRSPACAPCPRHGGYLLRHEYTQSKRRASASPSRTTTRRLWTATARRCGAGAWQETGSRCSRGKAPNPFLRATKCRPCKRAVGRMGVAIRSTVFAEVASKDVGSVGAETHDYAITVIPSIAGNLLLRP